MKFFMIVPYYLYWHYSRGFKELSRNLFNFVGFEFHFFSVKEMIRTLFKPFQRLKEKNTGSPIDIEAILSVLIVNIIMRGVGLFVRSMILICAAICISISFVFSILLIITWIVLPVVLLIFASISTIAYFKYKP